jgi:ribonuclease HII
MNKPSEKPNRKEEKALNSKGYHRIAGIDEAGRGALAGPVVAAAVILPENADFKWLAKVRDSKLLNGKTRETILVLMQEYQIEIGVGIVSASVIDNINILNATKKAMLLAVEQFNSPPDYVLIDAVVLPKLRTPQKNIIKGDRTCITISCASVVAKVTRDRIMMELDKEYPEYKFCNHKGYSTSEHIKCLQSFGASKVHRFTFGPVRELARII